MKTFSAKTHEVKRDWFVVDADNKVLGRLASEIARRLRGKHKPEFTPHVDTGDYIVVVNASKMVVTGNKDLDKKYYRHTGYPGGIYETNFRQDAGAFPRPCAGKGGQGHAAQGTARLRHDQENENLRGRGPSARGATAQAPRN